MLREMRTGMVFLSIGYLALGILLLAFPEQSLAWICYAFGAVILITGAINLIRCFRSHGSGPRAPLLLISGVAAFALGVFLLLSPAFVAGVLPVVFGLFMLLDGVLRAGSSVELARAHSPRWWVILLLALVSLALGAVLILQPQNALAPNTLLCGLFLAAEGALNLGCTLYAATELRALAREQAAADEALSAAMAKARGEVPPDAEVLPEEKPAHRLFGRRRKGAPAPAPGPDADADAPGLPDPAQPDDRPADEPAHETDLPDQNAPALELPDQAALYGSPPQK